MSCLNSTSPINITNNSAGTCELKCKYRYKYNDSATIITNKGDHLSLSYEKPTIDPVIYNSNPYYVEEVRIYVPSIHKYSDSTADAELIIVHRSDYSGKLLVCIPIKSGDTTSDLDTIVLLAKNHINSIGDTFLSKTINLNQFIPNKKMYIYKGTLPFDTCDGEHNIIVFNKLDDAYISVSRALIDYLKGFLTAHKIETKENKFYINKNGPISSLIDNSGDIYIDCKPTNEDGSIIGDEEDLVNANKMPTFYDFFANENIKSILNSKYYQIFLIILFAFIIYKVFLSILSMIGITNLSVSNIKSSST